MPRHRSPLPAELAVGFTTAQAKAAGVGHRRLQHSDIARVARGLYIRVDAGIAAGTNRAQPSAPSAGGDATHPAATWRRAQLDHALAIGKCLGQGVFFSHRTAAVLWGLPVPPGSSSSLEVSCFAPARAPRRAGLLSSNVQPHLARVVIHCGVPVTDPASTWAMLAPRLSFSDGIALGDAVIREPRRPGTQRVERPPLARREELAAMTISRRPGAARLRAMLPLLTHQSASAPETHLRLLFREWGFPEPELDHDVRDAHGRLLGCSEITFPRYRLAVEYEGTHHFTDSKQWNRDVEKYADYAEAGWLVVRVTSQLLYQQQSQLKHRVLHALIRRGWAGGGGTPALSPVGTR